MLEQGLGAMRIYQHLKCDHGITAMYRSVRCRDAWELPFLRMEVGPVQQMQDDFGSGSLMQEPRAQVD